jgi:pimeloyl-ACP methyl ester carboxylesterase
VKRVWLFYLFVLCFAWSGSPVQATVTYESQECRPSRLYGYRVECGTLTVPENRSDPQSRVIELAVMVIHSRSQTPEPDPIIYLAGGPGGSTTPDAGRLFEWWFKPFAETRDVIFFDQRGTGQSLPELNCDEMYDALIQRLSTLLPPAEESALMVDTIRRCHTRLTGSGIDTNAYHSAASAADLDDLRRALGYETWNLLGVSYGTRLALTVLRDYPEGTRSVILDSVYPPQSNLFTELLPNSQRAMQVLFNGCAADMPCAENYPDLETVFWTLYDRLNASPAYIPIVTRDGEQVSLLLTGDRLYDWVFGWLYTLEDIQSIPYWLYLLYDGDTDNPEVIRAGLLQESHVLAIDTGMYYAVQCSEELSLTDRDAFSLLPEQFPRLRDYIARNIEVNGQLQDGCAVWNTLPPNYLEDEPVVSEVPVLLLAGEYDPITPPQWAELAAETLPNSFSYTLSVGHGVLRSSRCGLEIAREFLANPADEPGRGCLESHTTPAFKIVRRIQPSAPSS